MDRLAKKIVEVRAGHKVLPDYLGTIKLKRLYDGLYMDSITTEVYVPNSSDRFQIVWHEPDKWLIVDMDTKILEHYPTVILLGTSGESAFDACSALNKEWNSRLAL